jgi:hypothetical protein
MAAPLEYVQPELFDEAVDRHHRSYVSAVLGRRRSDIGGRRSDTGQQSDTRYCRLVAGGHGDTVSRPARTAGRQGT